MGTTLCGLVSVRAGGTEHWMAFNVGDSRVYHLSEGRLTQLTIDHSEVEELVMAGQLTRDEARTYRRRNVVTRSLGTDPAPEPDSWVFPPTDGERFLVCSDGLTTEMTDGQIAACLLSNADPQQAARELVELALEAGGRDNITVIVVDGIRGDGPSDVDGDTTPGATMSDAGMTTPLVTYQSGNWMAITGPHVWLLVESEVGDPLVSNAWDALRQRDGLAAVQNVLRNSTGHGFRSFGLVARSGDFIAVILAGTAWADVDVGDASNQLRCPPGVLVAEYRLADNAAGLAIHGGQATEDAWFPIHTAVARASTLVLEWTAELGAEEQADLPPVGEHFARVPRVAHSAGHAADRRDQDEGAGGTSPVAKVATKVSMEIPGTAKAESLAPASPVDPVEEVIIPDTSAGGTTIPGALNPDLLTSEEPVPEEPAAGDFHSGSYDFLFGRTEARSVEDAAVRAPDADAVPEAASTVPPAALLPTGPPLAGPSRPPTPPPQTPPPSTREIKRAASSGLIDDVPWVSPENRDEEPGSARMVGADLPDAEQPGSDDHLQLTTSRMGPKTSLNRVPTVGSPDPLRQVVHAVRCPSQHPNPAHADVCRVCGAAISDQAAVSVPRPILGRLRLSTGDEVTLDRGVLMGRRPAEGRQQNGERPHLVKLQSLDQGVSRTHLEVRLDGWHVLVVDLNSTNGTLITRAGQAPERLRPHQPTMIEPGTLVTLADDVTFTYDATI